MSVYLHVCRWNQLDLAIVLLSIMGITLEEIEVNASLPINPTIIRIMRVLRIARGMISSPFSMTSCPISPSDTIAEQLLSRGFDFKEFCKKTYLWDSPICYLCMTDPSTVLAEGEPTRWHNWLTNKALRRN